MFFGVCKRALQQKVQFCKAAIRIRLQRSIFGDDVSVVVSKTPQGIFATHIEDMEVGRAIRKNEQYGIDEIGRIKSKVSVNEKILFVGSHIGTLVIPLAKISQYVVAIEANPKTYELLSWNLALNSCNNVRAYNIAASDKSETISFVSSRIQLGRIEAHAAYQGTDIFPR